MPSKFYRILFILIGLGLVVIASINLLKNVQDLTPVSTSEVSSDFIPIPIPPNQPTPTAAIGQPYFPPERILIPSIELDVSIEVAPIGLVTIDKKEYQQFVAPEKFAAGWHIGSAPLGVSGNTVLSGHHNAFGKVFKRLNELKEGDTFSLFSAGQEFKYIITARMILPEKDLPLEGRLENAKWILPTQDERVTLVTCWPAFSNTHRLILIAIPADRPQATPVITPTPESLFWVQNKIQWGVSVRAIPINDGEVLAVIPKQAVAKCLGRNANGDWFFVEYQQVRGWVSSELMRFEGNISQLRVFE